MTLGVGLHVGVAPAVYHADPCGAPTLTQSVACVLLDRSPLHAWHAHPQLGGWEALKTVPDPATLSRMERGSILHSLILGSGPGLRVVNALNWQKKFAQDERKDARSKGELPVLARDLASYQEMVAKLPPLPAPADRELTAVWHSYDGVLCRARMDLVWWAETAAGGAEVWDLKTCEDATRAASGSALVRDGRDIQAAAYVEAIETLRPELAGRVRYRWRFIEVEPPFATIDAGPSGELLELGRRRWSRAVAKWGECLRADEWPSYESPRRISPPGWALAVDLEQEMKLEGIEP